MIWSLRKGSIPPLISSEAMGFSTVKPRLLEHPSALQYSQEEKQVALSVKSGDAILSMHGENVLRPS